MRIIFKRTNNQLFKRGTIGSYTFCAKVYDIGSQYGIDGGRVSKLEMRKAGQLVLNYDRGWDIGLEAEDKKAYGKLMRALEGMPANA